MGSHCLGDDAIGRFRGSNVSTLAAINGQWRVVSTAGAIPVSEVDRGVIMNWRTARHRRLAYESRPLATVAATRLGYKSWHPRRAIFGIVHLTAERLLRPRVGPGRRREMRFQFTRPRAHDGAFTRDRASHVNGSLKTQRRDGSTTDVRRVPRDAPHATERA